MKKLLILLCLGIILASCNKPKQASIATYYSGPNNSMEILQVSYNGYHFMGGKEFVFASSAHNIDSIPVTMDYKSPGDFGYIRFIHTPTSDTFFDATIIWMGRGAISRPSGFDPSSSYPIISPAVSRPDTSDFQLLGPYSKDQLSPIPYDSIWAAIADRSVTKHMMQLHSKVAIYPYTPSVGMGDPNEWSWIILFYQ